VRLHCDTLASGPAPTQAIAFLHGILGGGVNLRSHARRLVERRPELMALLMDLRGHGQSQGRDGEDTVTAAARDVAETAAGLGRPLTQVVGHSFGGKVALELIELVPTLQRVVTLDSAPGPRLDARGSEATVRVLGLLARLLGPWKTREAFVAEVEGLGESRTMAGWLAMNLGPGADGFRLRLELPRIQALLDSYLALDAWPVLERAIARGRPRLELVIATASEVYRAEDRERAQRLAQRAPGQLAVHLLEGGHWVHVENSAGVDQVLLGEAPLESPA
jgi:pimeloyl-ACP methyl ester carboxylesterase